MGLIALFFRHSIRFQANLFTFSTLLQPGTFLFYLAIILFVGIVGGSYPAFYLSKFNPVNVLKGSLSKGSSNVTLRRALVVVQFSISMIMLICTWVVYGQLQYLRNKDLGFNKEQVLTVSANSNKDLTSNIRSFKNEVRKNPTRISPALHRAYRAAAFLLILFSIKQKTDILTRALMFILVLMKIILKPWE